VTRPGGEPHIYHVEVLDALTRIRSFTRDSRWFLIAASLWGFSFSVTWLLLNFLFEGLGFSQTLVGVANAVPNLTALAFALPVARLSERTGYVRMMRMGAFSAGVGLLGLSFSHGIAAAMVSVFFIGLGGMAFWVVPSPLMTALEPQANRTFLFSAQFAANLAAGFLGSLAGGWMPSLFAKIANVDPKSLQAVQWTVMVAALLYLVTALPLWKLTEVRPAEPSEGSGWHIPRQARRIILVLLVPNVFIGLGAGLIIPFLNIFVEGKFGISFGALGAVFAWSQLGMAIAVMLQPIIAERFGKTASIVIVQGLSLPFITMLGFSGSFAAVTIALFVRSALMNAANPIYAEFTMGQVREAWRPSLAAAETMVWSAGWTVGPLLSGWVRTRLGFAPGFHVLFVAMLVLYATGIAYTWFVLRPIERAGATDVDQPATG
jgi:MFS family permease